MYEMLRWLKYFPILDKEIARLVGLSAKSIKVGFDTHGFFNDLLFYTFNHDKNNPVDFIKEILSNIPFELFTYISESNAISDLLKYLKLNGQEEIVKTVLNKLSIAGLHPFARPLYDELFTSK